MTGIVRYRTVQYFPSSDSQRHWLSMNSGLARIDTLAKTTWTGKEMQMTSGNGLQLFKQPLMKSLPCRDIARQPRCVKFNYLQPLMKLLDVQLNQQVSE